MIMMTMQEKKLAEDHLYLVKDIILGTISIDESVQGLGYDDLYQTGCEALCYAATHYHAERGASFATFANIVIKHRLISNCRKALRIQMPLNYLDATLNNDADTTFAELLIDENEHALSDVETFHLLCEAEKNYAGVTQKGICALKLKCNGHTLKEIAQYFDVKPNHIAAWISKAAAKLRNDYYHACLQ